MNRQDNRGILLFPLYHNARVQREDNQEDSKPIEQLAPELASIISSDAEIARHTPDDYGGDNGPTEGPLWCSEGSYLLFSDIHNDRRMKFLPGQGVSVDKQPTNRVNGLTRDPQGRLIACEHDSRRVTRTEPDGSITVVEAGFQGRPLNHRNDVVVKFDGSIYFTDPWTPFTPPTQFDLQYLGVYRVTPDLGSITLLVEDFLMPNGLAFSPDESVLYINDTRQEHIRAFDLNPNGTLARETGRVLADLTGEAPGHPDGMKMDVEGNVYCGGSGGLWVMDPSGKKLGCVVHGASVTTNMCFGGADWRTLHFTSWNHLGSVQTNIADIPVPVK